MRKGGNKKGFIALCVIVPMVIALAFIPKVIKERKKRKYNLSF
ncbi:hypothetical protein CLNEO_10260 [Anaerotignum neopropionicum]|uniref:Uncharacterized protein n=1 Tax=Anaerotignum neopropionicum TaxID=36847 RepID=A0A136WHB5_9FIRM|nr:hypothetical protein CLNEO_10260 [Anaerotignum neopropionicum]